MPRSAGKHASINYRMDASLPFLCKAIKP